MWKRIGCFATAFLLLSSFIAMAEKPGGLVGEVKTATATVASVNKDTREVTLMGMDGGKVIFKAGPGVPNFARIQVGDKVTATTSRSLAIFLIPQGKTPSSSESESLSRAALGKKPAGSYTRIVDISATVEALDLKGRRMTLRGPKGNVVTLEVGDHVKRLDQVKVGDNVAAQYAEFVEISVSNP